MSALRFSFVVVTYNSADTIGPCINSIEAHTTSKCEVIVVDNSPNENTVRSLDQITIIRPDMAVRVIKPSENVGFGRACNLGARQAEGEFLFSQSRHGTCE